MLVALCAGLAAPGARAQEQILFPAVHNAQAALVQRIRAETVRVDVAIWLLGEREITQALIDRHRNGVRVRVLGDRASIFESDIHTRREFEHLAASGVPVRLRYHPTWFPEILHWKAAIFVGQNVVEFGSANYTTFELAPWSAVNFKDESVMFTDDPAIVRAFLTRFDRMWADTTTFMDWPQAYARETGIAWSAPMTINRARLEPDYPVDVPGMIWSQGSELLNTMIAEIDRETQRIDLVSYRLTVPSLTEALIRRFRLGVPVRVFIEPTQYRNPGFPEYWLVGAMADRLWAAGVPIKQRAHEGLTHMKALVTSSVALHGSANFTRFWQRDHNYVIAAAAKPGLYFAFRDRIDAMWQDTVNYQPFTPQRPDAPALVSPATGAAGVGTLTRLQWRRAPWAVAFDVYLGTVPGSLAFAGRVNAVVSEEPPETYAFTPAQALQPNTRYYWQVVSRTYATDQAPSLVATSELYTFMTGSGTGSAPPASACEPPAPGAGWSCVNGVWVPPASTPQPAPPPPAPAPLPAPAPAPSPSTSTCTTIQPAPSWVCVNGGWVPADSPLAGGAAASPPPAPAPAPAPAPSAVACTTVRPAANWVCVNGGWVPPDSPLAAAAPQMPPPSPLPLPAPSPGSCSGLPDPFVALGGGVCVNGNWVPRSHPLAGGGDDSAG